MAIMQQSGKGGAVSTISIPGTIKKLNLATALTAP